MREIHGSHIDRIQNIANVDYEVLDLWPRGLATTLSARTSDQPLQISLRAGLLVQGPGIFLQTGKSEVEPRRGSTTLAQSFSLPHHQIQVFFAPWEEWRKREMASSAILEACPPYRQWNAGKCLLCPDGCLLQNELLGTQSLFDAIVNCSEHFGAPL